MKTKISAALALAVLCTAALGPAAHAESSFVTGTTGSTSAHLDFQIVVPRFLFLQVGTGTQYAANATIDMITFTVNANGVGTGASGVVATGGDKTGGAVTAKVVGNNGAVTLNATTTGTLNDGAGDSISWAQISTTPSTLTSATPLSAPALADGATSTNVTVPAVNKVANQDAKWAYSFANSNVVAAGTYGGANVNNGRVTYTASMP